MLQQRFWRLATITGWLLYGATVGPASAHTEGDAQLIAGDRVVLGTVVEVRSGQARIDIGESQPRFVPMGVRHDKGLPALQPGDLVEIAVNDQNLLVDVHLPGEISHHRIVAGQLAVPMETGHDKVVIRTSAAKEESHHVRPVARSKVASIPVGADVIFLIDELDKVVDVTFGSSEAVHRAAALSQEKSPLKGNLNRIVGRIMKPLKDNTITVRAEDGHTHSYEARPLIQPRLSTLVEGDSAVFLVDDEGQVTDVAIPPEPDRERAR